MTASAPDPEPGPREAGGGRAKSSSWALGLRVASGVLFVPLLVVLTFVGGTVFLAFVIAQSALGLHEFYGMMRAKGHRPVAWLGHAAALGVLAFAYRPQTPYAAFFVTAGLLVLLALTLRTPTRRGIVESVSVTVFGVLYVAGLSSHFVLLRQLHMSGGFDPTDGARFVLYAFLVTWSCDTGAYVVGRWLGRTRPWAAISPRKTAEGSLGGFAFALVGAWVGAHWFMVSAAGVHWLRGIDVLAIGALVGVCGQVGDLVESLLKRDAGSGDSSDLIPGHGGILDRFDSLYFAAPLVYWYLKIVVFQIP